MALSLAVLASGRGSNLVTLVKAIEEGRLDARIALVLSNAPEAPVLTFARQKGLAVWAEDHAKAGGRAAFDEKMRAAITEAGAGAVVLAGYMRLLSPAFVAAFAGRIINLHPSLLPAFPGAHGARDTLAFGARLAGCSVHFVDEELDHGPVIIQAAVPVHAEDTENSLMPRIQAMEHRILPQAVAWMAEDRLRIEGRRVRLLPPQPGAGREPPISCGEAALGPWLVSPPLEGW